MRFATATVAAAALAASVSAQEPSYCKLNNRQPLHYNIPGRSSEIKSFQVIRPPLTAEQAEKCAPENYPECTAIYEIHLTPEFTSGPPNCNDIGMLPPHGRDQRVCADPKRNGLSPVESKFWEDPTQWEPKDRNRRNVLVDFSKHPFPDNSIKQSVAAGANAHTALMEETKNCFQSNGDWRDINDDNKAGSRNQYRDQTKDRSGGTNRQCAFPLGYMQDTIMKHKAVCVSIFGAEGRWVEIMAESAAGSNGGSFCVSDWGPEGEEQACTQGGDLYECREAGRSQATTRMDGTKWESNWRWSDRKDWAKTQHQMRVKFQAFDNIDDAQMEFNWRIVASKLAEGTTGQSGEEKDAEDWCQFRDPSQYPQEQLMGAYAKNFNGNPVFDVQTSSASRLAPALALAAAVAAAVLAF
jgi:hypothetical protein